MSSVDFRNAFEWRTASSINNGIELLEAGIEGVCFTRVNLAAEAIERLKRCVRGSTTCKALDLKECDFGYYGARAVAELLSDENMLSYLYLYDNDIGDAGTKLIAESLKLSSAATLTYLSLSKNNIGDLGAMYISDFMQANNSLLFLGLGSNNIGDRGAKYIAEGLKGNTALIELVLSYNKFQVEGDKALAAALQVNNTLTYLSLHQDKITQEGARALIETLKVNKTITYLGLGLYSSKASKNTRRKLRSVDRLLKRNVEDKRKSDESHRIAFEEALKNDAKGAWNRSKLMVVGKGRAGKTATIRSLQNLLFLPELPSTIGAAITNTQTRPNSEHRGWIRSDESKTDYTTGLAARISISRVQQDEALRRSNMRNSARSSTSRLTQIIQRMSEKRGSPKRMSRAKNCSMDKNRSSHSRSVNGSFDRLRISNQRSSPSRIAVPRPRNGSLDRISQSRLSRPRNRSTSISRGRNGSIDFPRRSRNGSVDVNFLDDENNSTITDLRNSNRRRISSARSSTSRAMIEFLSTPVDNNSNATSLGRKSVDHSNDVGVGATVGRLSKARNRQSRSRSNSKQAEITFAEEKPQELPMPLPPVMDIQQIEERVNEFTFLQAREHYEPINFAIWDYGGQNVFYTLHHLFLTNFGIYLVIFDMYHFLGNQKSSMDYLKFWLYTIKLHAPDAPVLIVGTFLDKINHSSELWQINNLTAGLVKRFPQVIPNEAEGLLFFPLNNKTGGGSEICRIREVVENVARNQPYVNRDVSLRWVRCLDEILEKGKNKNWISLTDGRDIARSLGISSANEVDTMLSFFNDLGVIVHLTGTENLKSIITTQPQWLVDSLAKVIRDRTLHPYDEAELKTLGLFDDVASLFETGLASRDLLEHLWDEHADFLIDLMRESMLLSNWRFGKEKCYLIPSMIVKDPAHYGMTSKLKGYKCTLDFSEGILPVGVFERLVCLCVEESALNPESHEPELYKGVACVYMGPDDFFVLTNSCESIIEVGIESPALAEKVLSMMLAIMRKLKNELMGKELIFKVKLGLADSEIGVPLEVAQHRKLSPWFPAKEFLSVSVDLDAFLNS